MPRKRLKHQKAKEDRDRTKRRYAGKLLRLAYTDTEFAGYWEGEIPSVNELTLDIHKLKRRAPTVPVKVFKTAVMRWLARYAAYFPQHNFYELDITVWVPLYTAQYKVIMRDVSNFIKVSEDSICAAVGRDDRFNLDVSIHKRNLPEGREPHWTFVFTGREKEEHEYERNIRSIAFKRLAENGAGFTPQEPPAQGRGRS